MALKGVQFIAQHIRNKDKDIEVSVQQRWARIFFLLVRKSKSANSWAHSAIANPQIFEVCPSANKPANLYANRESANFRGVPICKSQIRKFFFTYASIF